MQSVSNFADLFTRLASRGEARPRVAVACPHDESTQTAVFEALSNGIADFLLIGREDDIRRTPAVASFAARVEIINQPDTDMAAAEAVALVRQGRAQVLMKGLLNTDNLLRAILNKEQGLLAPGAVLSHVTATEIPGRRGLLLFSDAAVIPTPTLDQRRAQIMALAATARALGVATPRIALIHCSEKTSPKFPVTADYATLRREAAEGVFGQTIVDGPMDVKTACDPHSGLVKGIDSPIGGHANALLFPDIESGNVFYKTVTCFCHALNAGMLTGAQAPVVLPSRSDSAQSKLASLALACACAK